MERIRIMAGDCAPISPLSQTHEVIVVDGRISLYPVFGLFGGFFGSTGWYNQAGTTSLNIPNGSKIKGMTIRGRVAHFDAMFSVFIVRVPNGSHPNGYFSSQYTNDSIVKWLHLTPSLNNGYIHHEASRDDINHTVDLVNNSYMVRMEMVMNRETVTDSFHHAYLTDIEIRYELPTVKKVIALKPLKYAMKKIKGKSVNILKIPSEMKLLIEKK
jgi:hypothetical protein